MSDRIKIKYWWDAEKKWFCIIANDGVNEATVSLTPEEASLLSMNAVIDEPAATPAVGGEARETLWGQIAAVYGNLDAEDCAWIDREWMKMRGITAATPAPVAVGGEALDRDTIQTMLDLLNPLHGEMDRQLPEQFTDEREWDAPDDREYNINITARMERDLTQAVLILENRRAAPPASPLRGRITDEMLNAHLKATEEWVIPYEAATECGVSIECGITQEDADELNAQSRQQIRKGYTAALSASPPEQPLTKLGSSEPLGPHYDGTTMDNQQLHGTPRSAEGVTAGETAPPEQPAAARAPMLADISQIIQDGWYAGRSSVDVAEQILREFDAALDKAPDSSALMPPRTET